LVVKGSALARCLAVACFISQYIVGAGARAQEAATEGAALKISPVTEPEAAQVEAPSPGAEAFQRGLEALKVGREREAVAAFDAAYKADGNPAALLNLGIAYTNLGKPQAAVDALSAYIEHDKPRDAQTLDAARAEIERLRAENGRVLLTLVPAGAEVQVDGEKVEIRGEELLLVPGRRRVTVLAEGYMRFDQMVDVQAGQFRLEIRLLPDTQQIAASAPTPVGPAAPVAESEPQTDKSASDAAESCALGQFCFGPVLSLFGPPNLVGGGLHMRFGRYLGLGADYQFLPTINVNPISVGSSLMSVNARVYPFGGAFFLGGGFAYQAIDATLRDGDVLVGARASFPAVTANIGFMGHDGFILGADVGLLFPLGSTHVSVRDMSGKLAKAGATPEQVDNAKQQAQDRVSTLLNAMPVFLQVNLIRVGYMF
jgi:hypothetical protein